jgi:RimJ/RimL family protein N-acetyltransferase
MAERAGFDPRIYQNWTNYFGCEIGIHTAKERRRGLATLTAAATVEYALSNGFSTIGWQCSEDNLGSIGTAEKVGFERERDYAMWYAILKQEA